MKKIVIIGGGQIGSRHLQGLAKLKFECTIEVIDPSNESLSIARERYSQLPKNDLINNINYLNDLFFSKSDYYDLVIIATNADIRANVINNLLEVKRAKNLILEKIVFQSIKDFKNSIAKLKKNNVMAWVNCPKRLYNIYKELNHLLKNQKSISLYLQGGNWGLACNTIHFMDLMEFLTNSKPISYDISGLDKTIYESKRKGFKELGGTLKIMFENDNELILRDLKNSNAPIIITIMSKNISIVLNETTNKIYISEEKNNWNVVEKTFDATYQSGLTNIIVEEIFQTSNSSLTTIEDSYRQHTILINMFNEQIHKITGISSEYCPIT